MANGRRPPSRLREMSGSGSRDYAPAPSGQAPQRKSFDPTRTPAGYDPGYWHLALLFRDLAMKDDINLRAGVPVIYAEIKRIFEWFGLEQGSRPFRKRGDGKVERTYAQMYRDGDGSRVAWLDVGEAVVREFWSRVWDDDALSDFCDMDVLTRMTWEVCNHWESARGRAHAKAHPQPRPEPMKFRHRPDKEES